MKIEECPNCGSEVTHDSIARMDEFWQVICPSCWHRASGDSAEDAVDAWNSEE